MILVLARAPTLAASSSATSVRRASSIARESSIGRDVVGECSLRQVWAQAPRTPEQVELVVREFDTRLKTNPEAARKQIRSWIQGGTILLGPAKTARSSRASYFRSRLLGKFASRDVR